MGAMSDDVIEPGDRRHDDADEVPFDDRFEALPGLADTDEEVAGEILAFWEAARVRAGVVRTSVVTGMGVVGAVPPPAWSFGDSPQLADELLALVLEGTKTATAALVSEYEDADEPLPKKGDLSIVLDGDAAPRALIRTTAVDVVPFDAVGEEHAYLEGEGDRTLDSWREEHERYWRRNLAEGQEFTGDLPVVCERFEMVYPHR
jgi:uncharacterized protein YhfF